MYAIYPIYHIIYPMYAIIYINIYNILYDICGKSSEK